MRAVHLARRGAVYLVRFRLPADLASQLGLAELRRSLQTRDPAVARRRCLAATVWFRATVEQLRTMTTPTREALEKEAQAHFGRLQAQVDQPRGFAPDHFDQQLKEQLSESRTEIARLDGQLIANQFEKPVRALAAELAFASGATSASDLDEATRLIASRLAASAMREQMRYFVHQLTTPTVPFVSEDPVFRVGERSPSASVPPSTGGIRQETLKSAADGYLERKRLEKVGPSQLNEVGRALRYLQDAVNGDRPLSLVSKTELRGFRDDLTRLDATLKGRSSTFGARLTDDPDRQIRSVMAQRYWTTVQSFFAYATSEGLIDDDPSASLLIQMRRGEVTRTPLPFAEAEIRKLFATPLYVGYQADARVKVSGNLQRREARWWSAVLALHTGLRAGELGQLLPEDFDFDAEVPHLRVRHENSAGETVKTTKNASSVRDVPLLDVLLTLGLRQFVERQAKYKSQRVFQRFRLGTGGRTSDGLTKFWSDYLKVFGLWEPGRATHVFRHTVTQRLRAAGVYDYEIDPILGHANGGVTARYGRQGSRIDRSEDQIPLTDKLATLQRLDFGFDLVKALGGPFDAQRHG